MITKEQWKRFCNDINTAKEWGLDPAIEENPVVNTDNYVIMTKVNYGTRKIYRYEDLVETYQTLNYLYTKVRLRNATLQNIRPIFKAFYSRKIFQIEE